MVSGGHSPCGELLNSPASELPVVPSTPPVLPVAARRKAAYATPIPIHLRKEWRVPRIRKPGIIVLAALLVLIVMGVGLARSVFSMSYHSTGSSSATATPVFVHDVSAAKPTKLPTPESTKMPAFNATST